MPFGPHPKDWNGTPEERFWRNVYKTPNCWFWIGASSSGYGTLRINGRIEKAHVVSYRFHFGEPPKGRFILHRCDTPQCVRPDHIYAGTPAENQRDRARGGIGDCGPFKTHCPQGHEYTPENTLIRKEGWRSCRACAAEVAKIPPTTTKIP